MRPPPLTTLQVRLQQLLRIRLLIQLEAFASSARSARGKIGWNAASSFSMSKPPPA